MRWNLKAIPEKEKVAHLQEVLNIPEAIVQLLVQRGIETYDEAKKYFRPDLADLHDPFLMKDMDKAVARIEQALDKGEHIMVYGDYDVDGTTSVALVTSFLQKYSSHIATYIPDRYREGYGVSYEGINFATDNDITLIIALDCGIKAVAQIAYAREKGIDFIVCDHHLPGESLPDVIAVLDPKRTDCAYPYKELCGCGVGFKLIQALTQKKKESFDTLLPYLDLVVTAIGADIVPITGENRILAYHGLERINTQPRFGFSAIIGQLKKTELTITDVVFIIAPRINAAGRMDHGIKAVELLMATDEEAAQKIALDIENFNTDRKITDRDITQEALELIEKKGEQERFTTVVYNENWHKGVIGIVASRLTETYYRPTLVFTKSGDKLAASARSVIGFDIYSALEACAEHLVQFGGHKYAAGLTLEESEYEAFKQKFEEVVAQSIDRKLLTPSIQIDMELEFKQITAKFLRILKQFAPFGPGNMRPVFLTRNLLDTGYAKPVGEDGIHLKCALRPAKTKKYIGAIGFSLGNKIELLQSGEAFDAVYSLDENEWNGKVYQQLKLRDIS